MRHPPDVVATLPFVSIVRVALEPRDGATAKLPLKLPAIVEKLDAVAESNRLVPKLLAVLLLTAYVTVPRKKTFASNIPDSDASLIPKPSTLKSLMFED